MIAAFSPSGFHFTFLAVEQTSNGTSVLEYVKLQQFLCVSVIAIVHSCQTTLPSTGEYGDNLNEMSWAVGEVLDTLVKLKLEKNTLVLFISDHGGHVELCSEGGKNSPFRGMNVNCYCVPLLCLGEEGRKLGNREGMWICWVRLKVMREREILLL